MFQKNIGTINADDLAASSGSGSSVTPVGFHNVGALSGFGAVVSTTNCLPSSSGARNHDTCRFTDDKLLLVSINDSNNRPQVRIRTPDRTAKTWSDTTVQTLETVTAEQIRVVPVSSNRFLVTYMTSTKVRGVLIEANGLLTDIGTINTPFDIITTLGTRRNWLLQVIPDVVDKFILMYKDTTTFYARILSLSGSTVTVGAEASVAGNSGSTQENWDAKVMSATKAAYVSDGGTTNRTMEGVVATLDTTANTVSFGSIQTIINKTIFDSNASYRPYIRIVKYTSTRIIAIWCYNRNLTTAGYGDDGRNSYYMCTISFDGTTLSKTNKNHRVGRKFRSVATNVSDFMAYPAFALLDSKTLGFAMNVRVGYSGFAEYLAYIHIRIQDADKDRFDIYFQHNFDTNNSYWPGVFSQLNSQDWVLTYSSQVGAAHVRSHYVSVRNLSIGDSNWADFFICKEGHKAVIPTARGGAVNSTDNGLTSSNFYPHGNAGAWQAPFCYLVTGFGSISGTTYVCAMAVYVKGPNNYDMQFSVIDDITSVSTVYPLYPVPNIRFDRDMNSNTEAGIIVYGATDLTLAAITLQSDINNTENAIGAAITSTTVSGASGGGYSTGRAYGNSYSQNRVTVFHTGSTSTQLRLTNYDFTSTDAKTWSTGTDSLVATLGGTSIATGLTEIRDNPGVFVGIGSYNGTIKAYLMTQEPSFTLHASPDIRTGFSSGAWGTVVNLDATYSIVFYVNASSAGAGGPTYAKLIKHVVGSGTCTVLGSEITIYNNATYHTATETTKFTSQRLDADRAMCMPVNAVISMVKLDRTAETISVEYSAEDPAGVGYGASPYFLYGLGEPMEAGLLPTFKTGVGGCYMGFFDQRVTA